MEEIRLYEFDYDKPELSEYTLTHYGILGMKWGVRRYQNPDGSYTDAGRKRYGIKSKKTERTYTNKEDAIAARDLSYIDKHISDYSTKDLNDLMNRINTEQRLRDMANKPSKDAKNKVNAILNNRVIKALGTVSVAALAITGINWWNWLTSDSTEAFVFAKELMDFMKGAAGVVVGKKFKGYKKLIKTY